MRAHLSRLKIHYFETSFAIGFGKASRVKCRWYGGKTIYSNKKWKVNSSDMLRQLARLILVSRMEGLNKRSAQYIRINDAHENT